jgi:hypothetical protein
LQVDPSKIPLGANNMKPSTLQFEFGQADFNFAYLTLTDASKDRFSIPEFLVNKPKSSSDKRLDMFDFKLFDDPFGFQFSNNKDGDVLVHTNGSTIVYYEKYIQLDLQLPS